MTEDGMSKRIDGTAAPMHRELGPEQLETV